MPSIKYTKKPKTALEVVRMIGESTLPIEEFKIDLIQAYCLGFIARMEKESVLQTKKEKLDLSNVSDVPLVEHAHQFVK